MIPTNPPHAAPRPTQTVLDVRDLPSIVYGSRGVVWWGTIGFMVVESLTLIIGIASYFYLRRSFDQWPPPRTPLPDLGVPTLGLVLLLLVAVPTWLFDRGARRRDAKAIMLWGWVAAALTLVVAGIRLWELESLHVRWDQNAYGSVTWMIVIAHFTLLAVDVAETAVMSSIFTLGRQKDNYYVDATDNAFYTYFMIASWIPCYVVLFWVPRLLGAP